MRARRRRNSILVRKRLETVGCSRVLIDLLVLQRARNRRVVHLHDIQNKLRKVAFGVGLPEMPFSVPTTRNVYLPACQLLSGSNVNLRFRPSNTIHLGRDTKTFFPFASTLSFPAEFFSAQKAVYKRLREALSSSSSVNLGTRYVALAWSEATSSSTCWSCRELATGASLNSETVSTNSASADKPPESVPRTRSV